MSTPSAASEEQAQSAPYLVSIEQDPEKTENNPNSPRQRLLKDDVVPHPALDVALGESVEAKQPKRTLDMVVFGVTAVIAIGFVIWGFVSTASLADVSGDALSGTMEYLGWLFVLASSGFVVFALWLGLGRFGTIPLGRDDDEPEFRTSSWVAMMFSAGMGIGLMFFGVNEPLTFFADTGEFAVPGSSDLSQSRPGRSRWPRPSSTGPCTRGRSTPSWGSRSPTASSARAAPS